MPGLTPSAPIPSAPIGNSGSTNFALAASQFPQLQQQTQLQQQQIQLQQFAMQVQKQQLGQQAYAQIGQFTAGDPSRLSDPMLIQRALHISKALGVPAPIKTAENGVQMLDQNALITKPALDDATAQKALAMPIPVRKAFLDLHSGVSPDLYTAQPYVAPSAGSQTAAEKEVSDWAQKVNEGTFTPKAFVDFLSANRSRLEAMGYDLSHYFSPEYQKEQISAYGDAQIKKLQDAGIMMLDTGKYKEAIEKDMRIKMNLEHEDRVAANQTRRFVAQAQMSNAATRLQQSAERIDIQRQNVESLLGQRRFVDAARLAQLALTQQNAAQHDMTQMKIAIEKGLPLGANPDSRILDALNPETQGSLAQRMDAASVSFNNAIQLATSGENTNQSAMSGNPTSIVPTPGSVFNINVNAGGAGGANTSQRAQSAYKAGSAVPDAAGYVFTGRQRADGALEVRGTGGRLRYWKPA